MHCLNDVVLLSSNENHLEMNNLFQFKDDKYTFRHVQHLKEKTCKLDCTYHSCVLVRIDCGDLGTRRI